MAYSIDSIRRAHDDGHLGEVFMRHLWEGDRDPVIGEDRIRASFVDPRVSGSVNLEFVLIRCLASAWRGPMDEPELPFRVLVGTVLGRPRIAELPVEAWSRLAEIELSSDGSPTDLSMGAMGRKFVAMAGDAAIWDIFRLEDSPWKDGFFHHEDGVKVHDRGLERPGCLPGVISVRLGTNRDPVLAEMCRQAGVGETEVAQPQAVMLVLFAPATPRVEIGNAGGPQDRWRGARESGRHMNGTHLTRFVVENLSGVPERDTWSDDAYRTELFNAMREEYGKEPTLQEFLDTLACASPMRKLLPTYLTRYFPEVESIFHCCGDPAWDNSSPAQRFQLLVATAQEIMGQELAEMQG